MIRSITNFIFSQLILIICTASSGFCQPAGNEVDVPGYTFFQNGEVKRQVFFKVELGDSSIRNFNIYGDLESEGAFLNGKKNGLWKFYSQTGFLQKEAFFELGDLTDTLFEYEENGTPSSIMVYKNGKPNGRFFLLERGQPLLSGSFKDGKKHGLWKSYYWQDGLPESVGRFSDGMQDSTWTYFHPSGIEKVREEWDMGKLVSVSRWTLPEGKKVNSGKLKNGNGDRVYYFDNGIVFQFVELKNGVENGLETTYHSNGIIAEMGEMKNGKRSGTWSGFFDDGKPFFRVNFSDGLEQGEYIDWHFNGQIASIGYFKDGKKEGVFRNYDTLGLIETQLTYEDDTLNGEYFEYYPNGNLATKGFFESGNESGLWVTYFESGEVYSEGSFKDALPKGRWKYFFKNGSVRELGAFLLGEKDGEWEAFYENGKRESRGRYLDGERIGLWHSFDPITNNSFVSRYFMGSLMGRRDVYYKDSVFLQSEFWVNDGLDSISDFFDRKGNKHSSGNISNGQGELVLWHAVGTESAKGNLIGGLFEGVWVYFYEDGRMKARGQYSKGKKEGVWKYYDENGNLITRGKYQNDEPSGRWEYFNEFNKLEKVEIY